MKILAIQFRYLGDAALMTPALRALKQFFPGSALHVLVAQEIVPVLQHLPGLERVWGFPRRRGSARLKESWPVILALRRERFDRSVDFVGNDRGAILSLLCGAAQRLGPLWRRGFLGRRFCYTQTVRPLEGQHESRANLHLLSPWGIVAPERPELEIEADPSLSGAAEQLLPGPAILCHLAASQPKKEWPTAHWAELYRRASLAGLEMVFCSGLGHREQALLAELRRQIPAAPVLPALPDLATFLAVLKRARLFISGDTGPLHLAAGLGVPTIALFGPSSPQQWAPLGEQHRALQGAPCSCSTDSALCRAPRPCMAAISPDAVLQLVAQ
ncbi:MAG: glycosyltransferase family 9 protein [Verrucomicrobiota bacterium]